MSTELEGLPGREATVLAEQALLGALLLRPRNLASVADWLGAEHFYLPPHTALYAAMRHLADNGHPVLADGHPTSEQGLDWLTQATTLGAEQAPGLTPSYVHTLVNVCPQPEHTAAYGRMVLAGHARRSVAEHAARLAHTARDTQDADSRVELTCARADALASVLEKLARHWRPHPGSLPRTEPGPHPAVPNVTNNGTPTNKPSSQR